VREPNGDKRKSGRGGKRLVAGLLLAAVVGFFLLVGNTGRNKTKPQVTGAFIDHADTAFKAATMAPDTVPSPGIKPPGRESLFVKIPPVQKKRMIAVADTADTSKAAATREPQTESPDTAVSGSGSGAVKGDTGDCAGDTLDPWVYPDPSGGLHRGRLAVILRANKPCDISWRFETDTAWRPWNGIPISVERTVSFTFKAMDKCGRGMAERREYYEIADAQVPGLCPEGMELVSIGATRFCIDRYEWPNRKGALPVSYVSLAQAQDSCTAVGKRLCSSEEWSLACSGPYSYSYPYGREYERYACVTHDTTARPSGSRPECRAFFGMFDMSGNLLEWTSTPSRQNRQFNDVMGGFWQSGPRSGCFDSRYSYFPQNRHNPVGFRCCKTCASAEK
jgi:hypothetical protein